MPPYVLVTRYLRTQKNLGSKIEKRWKRGRTPYVCRKAVYKAIYITRYGKSAKITFFVVLNPFNKLSGTNLMP